MWKLYEPMADTAIDIKIRRPHGRGQIRHEDKHAAPSTGEQVLFLLENVGSVDNSRSTIA